MAKTAKNHIQIDQFKISGHHLFIGGRTIAELDTILGSTPFYAYDKAVIGQRIDDLRASLPKSIQLNYAIKANPFVPLINYMANKVDGFDVASKDELILALNAGMASQRISFAGPGKSDSALASAIASGAILHVESLNELIRACNIGEQLSVKPNLAFRVNPNFELKSSGMKMAGGSKPFGIDSELLLNELPHFDYQRFTMKGFHIYAGSQNLDETAIIDAHVNTFALAKSLIDNTPVTISHLNIGGGLGIPYFPGEQRIDISPICSNLSKLLEQHKATLKHVDIIMELGRYLVGEAGVYATRVVDIKESRGTRYVVVDGGLHHHLSNSGNFGQIIRKNYPVAVANKMEADLSSQQVTVVGPLCTPLDIIAEKVDLPEINVGDFVVVFQSGAYGASASPQAFLSQPKLQEILV